MEATVKQTAPFNTENVINITINAQFNEAELEEFLAICEAKFPEMYRAFGKAIG